MECHDFHRFFGDYPLPVNFVRPINYIQERSVRSVVEKRISNRYVLVDGERCSEVTLLVVYSPETELMNLIRNLIDWDMMREQPKTDPIYDYGRLDEVETFSQLMKLSTLWVNVTFENRKTASFKLTNYNPLTVEFSVPLTITIDGMREVISNFHMKKDSHSTPYKFWYENPKGSLQIEPYRLF